MSSASQQTPPTGSSSARPGAASDGRGNNRGDGSRRAAWLPVGFVALGVAELAILIAIGVNTSLWWSVLIVVLGWIIGVALLITAGQQSFVRLRSLVRAVRGSGDVQDHLSRPVFTLLSALAFFFPGLITDVVGVVMLLTPVQRRTVKKMGLGSGSQGARRVLYRRSSGGVIDGEIVINAEPTSNDTSGSARSRDSRTTGTDTTTPPTITQD